MKIGFPDLKNRQVLVTGVGIKPLATRFKEPVSGEDTHLPVFFGGIECKANIGAATSYMAAQMGANVQMIGRNPENLQGIKDWILSDIPSARVNYIVTDLTDKESRRKMYSEIPNDQSLYWVQSLGLGAGNVRLKDDNPYLPLDEIPAEAIDAELSVYRVTAAMMGELLPRFRRQKETRIAIVSSMSAVRAYPFGGLHSPAKAAISRFANSANLELYEENIFITDIRPGVIDTGMYDSDKVKEVSYAIGKSYGTAYSKGLPFAPPSAVASLIVSSLVLPIHITSVNMVARRQEPHEAS